MFCRNCGAELSPDSNVCIKCGVPAGQGTHFCPRCNSATDDLAVVCVNCGLPLAQYSPDSYNVNGVIMQRKSKLAAGLLGILLGSLGIHNFYLGYTSRAITQVLLCTVGSLACGIGPIIAAIWGIVEGIQILTGTINTDASGVPLKE